MELKCQQKKESTKFRLNERKRGKRSNPEKKAHYRPLISISIYINISVNINQYIGHQSIGQSIGNKLPKNIMRLNGEV